MTTVCLPVSRLSVCRSATFVCLHRLSIISVIWQKSRIDGQMTIRLMGRQNIGVHIFIYLISGAVWMKPWIPWPRTCFHVITINESFDKRQKYSNTELCTLVIRLQRIKSHKIIHKGEDISWNNTTLFNVKILQNNLQGFRYFTKWICCLHLQLTLQIT